MNNKITPLKLGLKFDPPAILLVYKERLKLRSRLIPAKNVDVLTDVSAYSAKFKANPKYADYFAKIPQTKVEKIVFILQDNMKGYTLKESLKRAEKYDPPKRPLAVTTDSEDQNGSFNDTSDDEEAVDEHNPPSVSTIEDVKARQKTQEKPADKEKEAKAIAIELLTSQMQMVRKNLYDFEDDDEEIEDEEMGDSNDGKKHVKQDGNKLEVPADDDDSHSSF